jgi:hypothetical protein
MCHRRKAKLLNASYGLLGSSVIFVPALGLFRSGSSLSSVAECGTGTFVGGVVMLISLPLFGLVLVWAVMSLLALRRVLTATDVTASVGLAIWNLVCTTLLCSLAMVSERSLAAILVVELVCASLAIYTLAVRDHNPVMSASDIV